jgi:hypothetical protein
MSYVRLFYAFAAGAVLAGCASVKTTQPDALLSAKPLTAQGATLESNAIAGFQAANVLCGTQAYGVTCASGMWETGKAVLDISCQRYLDKLALASQGHDYNRKETSLIGGFLAGALGLAKSPVSHVAGLALLTTTVNATQDNFSESYLFSPGGHQLASIVSKAQDAYLAARHETIDSGKYSYNTAVDLLLGYEDVCRPSTIRRLIDEAVANTEIKATVIGGSIADKDTSALLVQLSLVTGQAVEEANAARLFAWFANQLTDAAKAKGNDTVLRDLKILKSDADVKAQDAMDQTLRKDLSPVFAPLLLQSHPIRKRWAAYIAALSTDTPKAIQVNTTGAGALSKVTLTAK